MADIKNYAAINSDGLVVNTLLWDGVAEYDPGEGITLVEVGDSGAGIGWTYVNGEFVAPPVPEKSHEELVDEAETRKQSLIDLATQKIGPLQDAVDLDIATDKEKTQLIAWKKFRVFANRVDTSTAPNITWPTSPDDESTT